MVVPTFQIGVIFESSRGLLCISWGACRWGRYPLWHLSSFSPEKMPSKNKAKGCNFQPAIFRFIKLLVSGIFLLLGVECPGYQQPEVRPFSRHVLLNYVEVRSWRSWKFCVKIDSEKSDFHQTTEEKLRIHVGRVCGSNAIIYITC